MDSSLSDYLFNSDSNPHPIFSVLSPEQRNKLDETAITETIKKGGYIFEEGKQPRGLLYLSKGGAKVYKIGAGDREQIVRLVKPLSFVGYKALFAEKVHTTTAEAIEQSEIVIYNKRELNEIINTTPAFAKKIIKALASELGFNYNRIINLTQKHIRGRLAETLILISEMYGFEDDGQTLKVRFTRENIAHFSNMTTSNAIRTLKTFEKEGLITTENKSIRLLKGDTLKEISTLG